MVNVTGVVIDAGNNSSNNRVIYDGTAGIIVRSFDLGNESTDLSIGDSVLVKGGVSVFANVMQIEESPITIELLKSDADLPDPKLVTISEIGELYESQLVTIENVSFENAGGVFAGGGAIGNFNISDGTATMVFRIGSSSHPLVGGTVPAKCDITGFVGQFFDDYQISVRYIEDIIAKDGTGEVLSTPQETDSQLNLYPNPVIGNFVNIRLPEGVIHSDVKLDVLDFMGKEFIGKHDLIDSKIDISNLEKGMYILLIDYNDLSYFISFAKQ